MPITNTNGDPIDISSLDDLATPSAAEGPTDPVVEPGEPADPPADATADPIADPPADPPVDPVDEPDPADVDLSTDPNADPADHTDLDPDLSENAEVFTGLSGMLVEGGILSPTDEPIDSQEKLIAHFAKEVDAKVDERVKQVEEYMQAGIPFQEVSRIQSAIQQTNSITSEHLSQENVAEKLIVAEMRQKGMGEAEAQEYFELIRDAGKIPEKAADALESRKVQLATLLENKVTEVKTSQAQAIKDRQEQALALSKSVDAGEVLGKKLSPTTVAKLRATMDTVVAKHPVTGDPLNAVMKYKLDNPVDFEKNLLYLYTVTNEFKNLKAFERSAETQISRKFKDAVRTISAPGKSFTDTSKSSPNNRLKFDPDSIDDIVDAH